MAGLTLAPEGSGSLAKLQLIHELLHLTWPYLLVVMVIWFAV